MAKKTRKKFARKARDYMRAYRAGAKGLEADSAVQLLKTHRCMLDAAASFCSSDATVLCKDGYPRVRVEQAGDPTE